MSALNMWNLLAAARRRRTEQWKAPRELSQLREHRLRQLCHAAPSKPRTTGKPFRRAGLTPEGITE